MNRRVILSSKVKDEESGAVAKASLNRAIKLDGVDPKPSDLPMASAKPG